LKGDFALNWQDVDLCRLTGADLRRWRWRESKRP